MEPIGNVYADTFRADAYATLEFPGTYYLAYRDLPGLIRDYVTGTCALDFGCGAGRSTRFLRALGFDVTGVDISEAMLAKAREIDASGDYRLVRDESLHELSGTTYDLVLSVFTFDNIPTLSHKSAVLRSLKGLLRPDGRIVSLVSTPEIYRHEWTSFSTQDFPENANAVSGDTVRIVMLDVPDRRPVEDVLCPHEDYVGLFEAAGLTLLTAHKPLGREGEPFDWVSERTVAPWIVYVLATRD